jgi:phosphoserine phosphatase
VSGFRSVILDVDSTLSGVEGIDWLASWRGPETQASVAKLTDQAMQGTIPLEAVFAKRLDMVKPTAVQIKSLAQVYVARIARDAKESIARMQAKGVKITLVSGGIRQAILPIAREVGLEETEVHAVPLIFDDGGNYQGFDESCVLTRKYGKRLAVEQILLQRPAIAVGDGMTDFEIRPAVDAFGAYTGFVRREAVVGQADFVIEDFSQLVTLVLK